MGLVTHNKNKYDEGTKISEYFSLPESVEKPLDEKAKSKKEKNKTENKKKMPKIKK